MSGRGWFKSRPFDALVFRGLALAGLALAAIALTAAAAAPSWPWRLPEGVAPPPVAPGNPMLDTPAGAARVALGRRLFYDADLSINGTLACATCHVQRHSFTDEMPNHPGAHDDPGLRNVPSLLNVAYFTPLTWANPTARTLEDQALIPIAGTDPVEMGMSGHEGEIAHRLSASPCYRRLFRAAFPETRGRIDLAAVTRALAAFERTLVSYQTAWDRARTGETPLPPEAARGEALFRKTGCAACHSGMNFTDLAFHRLPGTPANGDLGVARVTGQATDAGLFRTPSLRNVLLTAPYLHDGSARTLNDALARHGITLSPADLAGLTAFFGALTDTAITTDPRLALPGKSCEVAG